STSLLDLSLGELLRRLGSSDPAPGGGAAAAVTGALGAALVQMTANLTVGRPRFADIAPQASAIEDRSATLRDRLAALGDVDAAAFDEVSTAYKLPRTDDAEKAARSAAIQTALRGAAQVPLETAQLCADVLAVAEEAAPLLNAAVISDVLVGALLAHAALESAAVNVEINLAAMSDIAAAEQFAADLAAAREGAAERLERILAAGRSRFSKPVRPT
ncbi:MAG TPA: cyclodeaminase/cyclohydrolase family protein, partial [Chloroflexota bacterium]|nr:cyclodeaminase/cyclohydrolase family protein [Chloroflexota bacterium]